MTLAMVNHSFSCIVNVNNDYTVLMKKTNTPNLKQICINNININISLKTTYLPTLPTQMIHESAGQTLPFIYHNLN